jgi:excisionase family DNA binding protein
VSRASPLTNASANEPSGAAGIVSDMKGTASRSAGGAELDEGSPSHALEKRIDKTAALRGPGLRRGSPSATSNTTASAGDDLRASPGAREGTWRWLTYREAAAYCGWSIPYLRNLVSAGQIPVYGRPRVRRFRRDMLDHFLTDPDAAMRSFRAERNAHGS